jgi:hypothetical protein
MLRPGSPAGRVSDGSNTVPCTSRCIPALLARVLRSRVSGWCEGACVPQHTAATEDETSECGISLRRPLPVQILALGFGLGTHQHVLARRHLRAAGTRSQATPERCKPKCQRGGQRPTTATPSLVGTDTSAATEDGDAPKATIAPYSNPWARLARPRRRPGRPDLAGFRPRVGRPRTMAAQPRFQSSAGPAGSCR